MSVRTKEMYRLVIHIFCTKPQCDGRRRQRGGEGVAFFILYLCYLMINRAHTPFEMEQDPPYSAERITTLRLFRCSQRLLGKGYKNIEYPCPR